MKRINNKSRLIAKRITVESIYNIISYSYAMIFVSGRYEVRTKTNDIAEMSISDGLKEALVKCGFTDRLQLLSYTTDELASMLKIDQYVARLILESAKQ
jgi:hypothetical protein